MKIVQVASGIYPIPSIDRAAAIEKIVYELSINLTLKGCDVHVIDIPSKERKQSKITFNEVQMSYFATLPSSTFRSIVFSFFSVFALLKLIKKTQVDVVHTHYSYSGLLSLLVCKLFRNVRHVHTTHAHDLVMYASSLKMLKSFSEIIVLKYSNHIVAETLTVKKQLIHRFKIPPQKITVVSSGVDMPANSQNVNSYENSVLSVGRLCARKNQLALVEAIPPVLTTHPNVKFIFAGPVEDKLYFQKITDFTERSNISKSVEFTGEISQEKLNALYSQATVFAFPTTAEIQGLVLLEAMSYGLPIVASRIGPIIDLVTEVPNSALLVDQDSKSFAVAINSLLDDNALRFKISQNAIKLASAFSWTDVANRILAVYTRITYVHQK